MSVLNEREFWTKFERENELKASLLNAFPAYDFALDIKGFSSTLAFLCREIDTLKTERVESGDIKKMVDLSTRAGVLYFAAYSTQLSFEQYFYQRSAKLIGGAMVKNADGKLVPHHPDLHPIVDAWKKSDAVKIVKAVRNRFQHGALLKGTLTYTFRTVHAPGGPGADITVSDDELWGKLGDTPAKQAEFAELCKKVFAASPDKLFALLSAYRSETVSVVSNLLSKFRALYPKEHGDRDALIAELKEIAEWFEARGLHSPWPSVPLEPDHV